MLNVKINVMTIIVAYPKWRVTMRALYKWEKSQKVGQESEKRCDLSFNN